MGTIGNPSIGDDSAVLIPSHQGEDNDSQVAGLVLGPSIGEAMTSRVNVDPSPHHARSSVASRHDNLVGESVSTTGASSFLVVICVFPKTIGFYWLLSWLGSRRQLSRLVFLSSPSINKYFPLIFPIPLFPSQGVVSGMSGRSGIAGASFAGLSALGDSASYADSILAETVSASSVPAAPVSGPQQQSFHHPNR